MEYLQLEYRRPFSGEYLLFKVLHLAFLGISPQDLASLSLFMAKQEEPDHYWRRVIGDPGELKKAGVKHPDSFLKFAALTDELQLALANESIPAFMEKLINRSGLLKYITEHPEKLWLMQVLNTFFTFIRQESIRRPRMTLSRLQELLGSMDDNRLQIGLEKVIQAHEGVHLLTAHGAKGLEFRYVFLLDCVKDFWEPRNRSSYRFVMPDTLTFSGEEDAMEARRRLFFVAMTRAKEGL